MFLYLVLKSMIRREQCHCDQCKLRRIKYQRTESHSALVLLVLLPVLWVVLC